MAPRRRRPRSVRRCPRTRRRIAALYDAAKKEGKVSWWDQHEQSVAQKFVDAFQKQFPGVNVEFFEGTQDVLKARSVQEARAGRVSFDFIDTGQNWPAYQDAGIVDDNTNFTDLLASAGVDKQFIVNGTYSPEFTVVRRRVQHRSGQARKSCRRTWTASADPKWKGQLAIETRLRPYVYGTPFLGGEENVVEMLRSTEGEQSAADRWRHQEPGAAGGRRVPGAGRGVFAAADHDEGQAVGLRAASKRCGRTVPRPGYIVPLTAPHPNAGKLFMWWFMSPEGQALTDSLRFKGNPAPGTGTGRPSTCRSTTSAIKFSPRRVRGQLRQVPAQVPGGARAASYIDCL